MMIQARHMTCIGRHGYEHSFRSHFGSSPDRGPSPRTIAKAGPSLCQRVRGNPELYQPFGRVRGAEEYLALFEQERMRYPVLLVHAPSYAGKSEFAVSLFKKPLYLEIGASGLWPPGMKQLDRSTHDGLVLDDLRDLEFIHANQEKL